MSQECEEVQFKIIKMFGCLTPYEVDVTRAEINDHLLRCASCRAYLSEQYLKKKSEWERAK